MPQPVTSEDTGLPVPLAVFAREVGPSVSYRQVRVRGRTAMLPVVVPGTPDEIWLKMLAVRHPNERHTLAGWRALIEKYRDEPAHPSHRDWSKRFTLPGVV
jgi:hypothetical protein